MLWLEAAGTEGILYSDNLNGDTLRFKASVALKAIQILTKLLQVKTGRKKKRQFHYSEIKITLLSATHNLILSILRRFIKTTPSFMKHRLQHSERKKKSKRKKQSLVYFLYRV